MSDEHMQTDQKDSSGKDYTKIIGEIISNVNKSLKSPIQIILNTPEKPTEGYVEVENDGKSTNTRAASSPQRKEEHHEDSSDEEETLGMEKKDASDDGSLSAVGNEGVGGPGSSGDRTDDEN